MNGLFQAAVELEDFFQGKAWPFCFIGGLAVIRWGEPRMTQDIDICLVTGFGEEEPFVTKVLGTFSPRVNDAAEFALSRRILLIQSTEGVPIDITLGALPFEESMIARASKYRFDEEAEVTTCSAEDLIVMKAFADRPKDWSDAESVILRQRGELDADYIERQLEPLCEVKETIEPLNRIKQLLRKY